METDRPRSPFQSDTPVAAIRVLGVSSTRHNAIKSLRSDQFLAEV